MEDEHASPEPGTGTYTATTSVTVTAITPGAEIHYTTNGVDPTTSDATVTSGQRGDDRELGHA